MPRRKRERTIGEALANPRNAQERAAVAKMKALGEQLREGIRQQRARIEMANDPTRFIRPMPWIPPLADEVSVEAMSPPPVERHRPRSQLDENAFAAVRERMSRDKLFPRRACELVAAERGLKFEPFYKRFMRARQRT